MAIISRPVDLKSGWVTWTVAALTGDTDDAGTGFDLRSTTSYVKFVPEAVLLRYQGVSVLPRPIVAPLVEGALSNVNREPGPVELPVNDPAVWNYRVELWVGADLWAKFWTDIPEGGSAEALDLANVANVAGKGGPVAIISGPKGPEGPVGPEGPYGGTVVNDAQMAQIVEQGELTPSAIGTVAVARGARTWTADDFSPASLQSAVAAAVSSGLALELAADQTVTSNIAGFWDAQTVGPGRITRDGHTLTLNRTAKDEITTNTIYVNGDLGDDANDGITPDRPLKSLPGVYTKVLRRLTSAQAAGARWVIRMSGTFSEGVSLRQVPDFPFGLSFEGDPLVEGSPVTTVSMSPGTSQFGIRIEPGIQLVEIRNLRFVDFAVGFNGYGVLMKGPGVLKVNDCETVGCDIGFAAIRNVDFHFGNCVATGNLSTGFRAQYGAMGTFDNCEASNSTTGFHLTSNAVAHVDYCVMERCEIGMRVEMASRAVALQCHFKRNEVGVRAIGAAEWRDSDSEFYVGTPDANGETYKHFGVSREWAMYSQTALVGFEVGNSREVAADPVEITGSTGNVSAYVGRYMGVLPAGFFSTPSKKFTVTLFGRATLSSTARVRLYVTNASGGGAVLLGELTLEPTGNAAWKAEFEVDAVSESSQKVFATLFQNGKAGKVSHQDRSVDFGIERVIRIYANLTEASDSITFLKSETKLQG